MTLDFSRCRPVPLADGTLSHVKEHVKIGVKALVEHPFFFLTDEMGAMKSAQVIIAAQFLFEAGVIDKVLVVAPASVRGVWFDPELGELAKHLFTPSIVTEFHARTRNWSTPYDKTKTLPFPQTEKIPLLQWLVTNYEFLVSKNRLTQLLPFCTAKTLLVLDESAYVKTYDSARTKACRRIRDLCGRVVLLNGTPIAHSPMDLFAQGNILHPSILGIKYITHFKARYAVEQPIGNMQYRGRPIQKIVGWRDLDELTGRFAPYVLRRLKKDCLDLPEALPPVTHEVALTETTWTHYKAMRDEMVTWLKSGDVSVSSTGAIKAMRLSQITSGFVGGVEDAGIDNGPATQIAAMKEPCGHGWHFGGSCNGVSEQQSDASHRTDHVEDSRVPEDRREESTESLQSRLQQDSRNTHRSVQAIGREKLDFVLGLHREWLDADPNLKLIVWCRFRAELARMMQDVENTYDNHPFLQIGQIHGGQKRADRESALRLLDPRTAPPGPVFFGGTYGTGALGINLTACHTVINMSTDYSLWKAQQTAARVDCPGQVHAVSYYDIQAVGPKGQKTIDFQIIKARREREDIANWTTARWIDAIMEE